MTAITVVLAMFSCEHVGIFGRSLRYHLIMRTMALTVMSAFAQLAPDRVKYPNEEILTG